MRTGSFDGPEAAKAAEGRVRALRDAVRVAADRLHGAEPVRIREIHDSLWVACSAIGEGDMGGDGVAIGRQFEAMFERLGALAEGQPEPVPPTALGLPGDARFLSDMADYLTRRYGLDAE